MTIHFAAARSAKHSPVARVLTRRAIGGPANDNWTGPQAPVQDDRLLHAALRHFAGHGHHAAYAARARAEAAYAGGEQQSGDWWLGICATLDKRMAASCAGKMRDQAIN